MTAEDQLAQRIAFALSQIFSIAPAFLTYASLSEAYTYFYDLFVLNSNGTYKNVMKNIAFSVKMGMQLSHVGSTSLRYEYDRSNKIIFPDENYARESCQLETVGLDMLNMDGTPKLDSLGRTIQVYDTTDILTFARVWTGLDYPARRGNYEEKGPNKINWMDPMTLLDGDKHDWFPKKDLLDSWIGDRYPLCYDLQEKPFLKSGSVYKLLGRSSSPRYQYDPGFWDGNGEIKRLTLDSANSALYDTLCNESSGVCTYPTVVTLSSDLVCDGLECDVNTVRVVQVSPNVFYEYVQRPCVNLAFIESGFSKAVFAGSSNGAGMCADSRRPVATSTCCPSGGGTKISCVYNGEYVNYDTNTNRCGAEGDVCPAGTNSISDQSECPHQTGYSQSSPKSNFFQWTKGDCNFKVKVRLDGMIAMIHEPEGISRVVKYVDNSVGNMNFFHVSFISRICVFILSYPTNMTY